MSLPRSHEWVDAKGKLVFVHEKYADGGWAYRHPIATETGICLEHGEKPKPPKTKRINEQWWCYGKPAIADGLLWNMPAVVEAIKAGKPIHWCAGEKDAIRLQRELPPGHVATSVHQGEGHGGATKEQFALFGECRSKIYLYADCDHREKPGKYTGWRDAIDRYDGLLKVGIGEDQLRVRLPKSGNDVYDHFEAGHKVRQFMRPNSMEKFRQKASRRPAKKASATPTGGHLLETFHKALESHGSRRGHGEDWTCPHPGHDDQRPSFGVTVGDTGVVVMNCQSCMPESGTPEHTTWLREILDSLDLDWSDVGQRSIDEDGFWDSRPELQCIRTFAWAQMASPWAVLANVLARVVCQVGPSVVLPDVIGSYASLNLSVALVGDSGEGKGNATKVARDAVSVGVPEFSEHTLGSGQGIAHMYAHREKDVGVVFHAQSVLIDVEEIDFLAAHNNQSGSTLLPELRRFGMGEKLGAAYVDPVRRIEVPAHAYRGAVVLGVQPSRAKVLIGAADGGTPQRFMWVRTVDPTAPGTRPDRPESWQWHLPEDLPEKLPGPSLRGKEIRPIDVCKVAVDEIREAADERSRGRGDPLLGHALLTRERIAAALGLLNGHYGVTEQDWALAGIAMRMSDATRDYVAEVLAKRSEADDASRGRSQGRRDIAAQEVKDQAQVQRVSKKIKRALERKSGEWLATSKLKRTLNVDDRPHYDEAIEHLVGSAAIDVEEVTYRSQKGWKYRFTG
jgi:hypothetical protein